MKQSRETWKELAKTCALSSLQKGCELMKEGGVPLNAVQATILNRILYSNIVAAFDSVAEESAKGEDVSSAIRK